MKEARAGYQRSLQVARELTELYPANPSYRHDALRAEQRLAQICDS